MHLLAALALRLSALAVGVDVHWQVEPGVTCPTAGQLQAAWAAHLPSLPLADRPDLPGVTSVALRRGKGRSILLRFSVAQPPVELEREIPTDSAAKCNDVADTIAILVGAWLLEVKQAAGEAPEPPPPTELAAVEVAAAPPIDHRQKPSLDVTVGAGALAGQGPAVAPAISLGLELRLPPLVGIGLRASWLGNLSVSDTPFGSMGVQRAVFGAYAALTIPPLQRAMRDLMGVRPYLGPLLWYASAQSYGYQTTLQQQSLVPGLQAGVLLDKTVVRPIFVSLQVGAIGLLQSTAYSVTRTLGAPTTLTTLGPWAFDLGLSVGAQFF